MPGLPSPTQLNLFCNIYGFIL